MKRIILIILFGAVLILYGCNDDDNSSSDPISQLPPETQTGENTFGYLLNDEAINVKNSSKITAIYQGGILQLGGGVENETIDIDIRIIIQNSIEEGIQYDLTNIPIHRSRYIDFNQFNECEYNFEDTYDGNIIFTNIDEVNFVLSGTFEFSTITDNCEDIKITNGRFDVRYTP